MSTYVSELNSDPLTQKDVTHETSNEVNSEVDDQTIDVADQTRSNWQSDSANSIKGFCMGVCDAVPGVSGGTVALIAGIYERLFIAISHIDTRLFSFLRRREFGRAARHVDFRFLVTLLFGIGIGYVVMSLAIKVLMASDTLRALTLSAFAGMVIGSVIIVFSKIGARKEQMVGCVLAGIAGCAISMAIAFQNVAATTGEVSLIYLFLCTVVAICAMILPGISGAMLLLIFGVYYYVLEIPRNLIHFENVGHNLIKMFVVLAGCTVGLLTFGRAIKWLLHNFKAITLSAMLGLMVGSLVVLWPYQNRIEPVVEHHKPTYQAYVPAEFNSLSLAVIGTVLFFAASVFFIDRWASQIAKRKLDQASQTV